MDFDSIKQLRWTRTMGQRNTPGIGRNPQAACNLRGVLYIRDSRLKALPKPRQNSQPVIERASLSQVGHSLRTKGVISYANQRNAIMLANQLYSPFQFHVRGTAV